MNIFKDSLFCNLLVAEAIKIKEQSEKNFSHSKTKPSFQLQSYKSCTNKNKVKKYLSNQ